MTPNLKAAATKAGVKQAAREARQAEADYRYLERGADGARVRKATQTEWERANEAAARALDPDAPIEVAGVGRCRVVG